MGVFEGEGWGVALEGKRVEKGGERGGGDM